MRRAMPTCSAGITPPTYAPAAHLRPSIPTCRKERGKAQAGPLVAHGSEPPAPLGSIIRDGRRKRRSDDPCLGTAYGYIKLPKELDRERQRATHWQECDAHEQRRTCTLKRGIVASHRAISGGTPLHLLRVLLPPRSSLQLSYSIQSHQTGRRAVTAWTTVEETVSRVPTPTVQHDIDAR